MGIHVEWLGTKYLTVHVAPAGAEIGEDTVDEGNVGLTFGEDTITVIEGTSEEVRAILHRALAKLDEMTPALPSLPDPSAEDGDVEEEHDVACPHVYTEADAEAVRQRNAEYVTQMRAMHGDAANLYEHPVPVPGETCGAELNLWDKEPVRRSLYIRGDRWIAGPSSYADGGGGDEEVQCGNLHSWSVPNIDEWQ